MKTTPKPRSKPALHVYKIEGGETHWVVASSPRDAIKRFATDYGYTTIALYRKDCPDVTVSRLLDEEELTISMEDEKGDYEDLTQTCAEWTKNGKGIIATTNI